MTTRPHPRHLIFTSALRNFYAIAPHRDIISWATDNIDFSEDVSAERTEGLAEILEREMERQSDAYRQAVAAGELQPVKVAFTEPETQFLYRDLMMQYMIKSAADFVKPVRYIDTPAKNRLFQEAESF